MNMDLVAGTTQVSDPYDGILPVLEARVETHRAKETESEAMKALETDPELATVQQPIQVIEKARHQGWTFKMGVQYRDGGVQDSGIKRNCPDCTSGLIRIIRNSDDTVRHVNGEKCKRFHP